MDSIPMTWRDYLLIGVIALSLFVALVSALVVAHQFLSERAETKKDQERVVVKS